MSLQAKTATRVRMRQPEPANYPHPHWATPALPTGNP